MRRLLRSKRLDGIDPAGKACRQVRRGQCAANQQYDNGGDPESAEELNKMWADQPNWPADLRGQYSIDPPVQEFIANAMKR